MIFLLVVLAVVLLVILLQQSNLVFKKRGVNHLAPLPFFGNYANVVFKREHISISMQKFYNAFPNDRFVGFYEFLNPVIIIKDPDLIGKIMIEDSNTFLDTRFGLLIGNTEWWERRKSISVCFATSKLQMIVPFVAKAGIQTNQAIKEEIKKSGVDNADLETTDLMHRYTFDVIAAIVLGINYNSHTKTKGKNELFDPMIKSMKGVKDTIDNYIIFGTFPKIVKILRPSILPLTSLMFYKNLLDNIRPRNTEKHERSGLDLLKLMTTSTGKVKTSKDTGNTLNSMYFDDVTKNAMLFFVAGFEAIVNAMRFLLYELAVNPEVQEKLANEIKEADEKNNGEVDYETLKNMKYLEMVIYESIRKWPTPLRERICAEDYNLGKPNSSAKNDYIMLKGESVWISVTSLNYDSKYFPDPEKFDPERFNDENRAKIDPNIYSPFGIGRRNCIGHRYSMMKVKAMAYTIIRDFEVSPCKRTSPFINLAPSSIWTCNADGHWLKYKLRSKRD